MNIGALSPQALQVALADLRKAQTLSPGAGKSGGLTPATSFHEALAAQIAGQAESALHPQSIGTAGGTSPSGPAGLITEIIKNTQERQAAASQAVQGVIQGNGSLHHAMMAMEEAGVSFQLLVEMRNKVVESLQELMRMQI